MSDLLFTVYGQACKKLTLDELLERHDQDLDIVNAHNARLDVIEAELRERGFDLCDCGAPVGGTHALACPHRDSAEIPDPQPPTAAGPELIAAATEPLADKSAAVAQAVAAFERPDPALDERVDRFTHEPEDEEGDDDA